MDVICYAADMHTIATEFSARCREVSVHSWPLCAVDPRFSVPGAENDMEDDVTEGLGHARNLEQIAGRSESRFQHLCHFGHRVLGRCPRLSIGAAPSARRFRGGAQLSL